MGTPATNVQQPKKNVPAEQGNKPAQEAQKRQDRPQTQTPRPSQPQQQQKEGGNKNQKDRTGSDLPKYGDRPEQTPDIQDKKDRNSAENNTQKQSFAGE